MLQKSINTRFAEAREFLAKVNVLADVLERVLIRALLGSAPAEDVGK